MAELGEGARPGPLLPPEQAAESEAAALDLHWILAVLSAHWKLLVLLPVCAFVATFVGVGFVRPLYKSTTEVLVVDPRVQIGEAGQRLSNFETDNAAMSSDIALLQSKALALRVATEFQLDRDPEFYSPRASSGLFHWLGLTPSERSRARDEAEEEKDSAVDKAAEQLRKTIQIERVQLSYVLTVSVSSEIPSKARRLAQAIAIGFLRERREIRDETMQRALEWWKTRVMELRARMAETESDLEKLKAENGIGDNAGSPTLQRLNALRADSQTYAKLRELEPVAQSYRKFYEAALAQLDGITQRLSLEGAAGRVITPASMPDSPSYPRRGLVYAFASVISIGATVALAFLLEILGSGIKTATSLERAAGHPILGMVPEVEGIKNPLGRNHALQFLLDKPQSQFAQAVRSARTMLWLGDSSSNGRMLLVTSAVQGEGKSTATMLLAASAGRAGERALVIDCDIRGRSVSREFGLYHSGWTDVLAGTADLATATLSDQKLRFSVLAVGNAVPSEDLLFSEQMRDLLENLRREYDTIVIDSPPLLAVIDAAVLAKSVDQIVIVVEWNRTPLASVIEALKLCRFAAHRIGGLILNKVDYDRLHRYGHGIRYPYDGAQHDGAAASDCRT